VNPKQFVRAIEAYYGPYERLLVKKTVLRYAEQFGQEKLQQIYHNLILEFSGQYRVTPDVAAIEKTRRLLEKNQDDGVYRNGRRIGHMDGSRFIPDLSLLSTHAFREYVLDYQMYEYPQGYSELLRDDRERRKLITGDGE
jgi:hypothetical protein